VTTRFRRALLAASAALLGALIAPAVVAAHAISAIYESRLPLPVYLAGAAAAVMPFLTLTIAYSFVAVAHFALPRPTTEEPS